MPQVKINNTWITLDEFFLFEELQEKVKQIGGNPFDIKVEAIEDLHENLLDEGEILDEDKFESIYEYLELIQENDLQSVHAFINAYSHFDLNKFESAFRGKYDSEYAFAVEMFNEIYLSDIPAEIHNFIDYKAYSSMLFMGGAYTYKDGYVFEM